jgi:F0F1-type ATP synthase membrane subunit c/vacuolar-type H+-ATPase subunit K
MKKSSIIRILLILSFFWATAFLSIVWAQVESSGIAVSISLKDENVEDGSLICSSEEGFTMCNGVYSSSMFGVVSDNPAAAFESEGEEGTRLVISSGKAKIRVSSINGNIAEGDFVTSSDIPGVAQLADRNGYVLGTAMESYDSADAERVGEILVALNVHAEAGISGPRANLIQVLKEGLTAPIFEPLDTLRYFLAAAVVVLAFLLGFIYFGRVAKAGIEAMGRNPLASKMIQLSVVLHVLITIIIILVGLAVGYLILLL